MTTALATSSTTTPSQVLALLDGARAAIASVQHPVEAAQLVVRAEAIAYLAKKAKASEEIQQQAVAVTIGAKQRAGELLVQIPKPKGGRPAETGTTVSPVLPTLEEMGITRRDSSNWQKLAEQPEAVTEYIEDATSTGIEITTAGAVRAAKKQSPKKPRKAKKKTTKNEKSLAVDAVYQLITDAQILALHATKVWEEATPKEAAYMARHLPTALSTITFLLENKK